MIFDELERAIVDFSATLDDVIRESMIAHKEDLLHEQREQLFEGKASSGDDLRPFYSEDLFYRGGYFLTPESADRYREWKEQLTYPTRVVKQNPDAPNLYINGRFHNELDIDFGGSAMCFGGSTPYSDKIVSKYGEENFGLTDERMQGICDEYTKEDIINNLLDKIYESID